VVFSARPPPLRYCYCCPYLSRSAATVNGLAAMTGAPRPVTLLLSCESHDFRARGYSRRVEAACMHDGYGKL
jgi:hypothetical protein